MFLFEADLRYVPGFRGIVLSGTARTQRPFLWDRRRLAAMTEGRDARVADSAFLLQIGFKSVYLQIIILNDRAIEPKL